MGMLGDRFDKAIMTSLQFSEGLWGRKLGVGHVCNLSEGIILVWSGWLLRHAGQ